MRYADEKKYHEVRPRVLYWDGSTWTEMSTPEMPQNPIPEGGLQSAYVSDIACVTVAGGGGGLRDKRCTLTGMYITKVADPESGRDIIHQEQGAMAATWNGAKWRVTKSPITCRHCYYPAAVSCARPNWCLSVGWKIVKSRHYGRVERWNGKKWSAVKVSGLRHGSLLGSVDCPAVNRCGVAGEHANRRGFYSGMAGTYNKSGFDFDKRDHMPGRAAACAKPGACVVTSRTNGAVLRNGTWRLVPMAQTGTTQYQDSYDTSCVSATWCMSVGERSNQHYPGAQLFRNGRWKATDRTERGWFYFGVDCPRRGWCVGVGAGRGVSKRPLLVLWDGKRWKRMTAPT